MIEAKDLRIGNWLYGKVSDTYYKVEPTDILRIFEYNKNIEPIPLTKDILEKCGFKKDLDMFYYNKPLAILLHDNGVTVTFSSICLPCEYLHQLQNLYYALTQTELEINLNEQ